MTGELERALVGLVRAITQLLENSDGLVSEVRVLVQQEMARKGGKP